MSEYKYLVSHFGDGTECAIGIHNAKRLKTHIHTLNGKENGQISQKGSNKVKVVCIIQKSLHQINCTAQ